MNIVIENLNSSIIDSISIATVKRLNGTYDVGTLFNEISSLSYEKVIMDITSLNNYNDINVLKSLISFIKPDKLILVLNKENISIEYLNSIIEIGIYNIAYGFDCSCRISFNIRKRKSILYQRLQLHYTYTAKLLINNISRVTLQIRFEIIVNYTNQSLSCFCGCPSNVRSNYQVLHTQQRTILPHRFNIYNINCST